MTARKCGCGRPVATPHYFHVTGHCDCIYHDSVRCLTCGPGKRFAAEVELWLSVVTVAHGDRLTAYACGLLDWTEL